MGDESLLGAPAKSGEFVEPVEVSPAPKAKAQKLPKIFEEPRDIDTRSKTHSLLCIMWGQPARSTGIHG